MVSPRMRKTAKPYTFARKQVRRVGQNVAPSCMSWMNVAEVPITVTSAAISMKPKALGMALALFVFLNITMLIIVQMHASTPPNTKQTSKFMVFSFRFKNNR